MDLLVIDRGNTRTKVAVFNDKELCCVQKFEQLTKEDLLKFIEEHPCRASIVSSSGSEVDDIMSWLNESCIKKNVHLTNQTKIPLLNLYQPPSALGMDRLATAVGAADSFPNQDLLIFDLGTAITIDYVSAKGEFRGGNISPGLAMRFAALHRFTKRLPLIESGSWPRSSRQFGISTHQAIYQGVINGICHEIEGYIAENPEKTIFFTGGDALFFEKQIKKTIFADSQATLRGLRVILENICSNE